MTIWSSVQSMEQAGVSFSVVGIHMYPATVVETTQQYSVGPPYKGYTVVGSSLIELCHYFVVIQVKLSSIPM